MTKVTFSDGSLLSIWLKIQLQLRGHWTTQACKKLTGKNSKPTIETPCSPISQISDTFLPVEINKTTEIMAFRENYQQPVSIFEDGTAVAADSQVVKCNIFS